MPRTIFDIEFLSVTVMPHCVYVSRMNCEQLRRDNQGYSDTVISVLSDLIVGGIHDDSDPDGELFFYVPTRSVKLDGRDVSGTYDVGY